MEVTSAAHKRLVVSGFVLLCFGILAWLYTGTGARLSILTGEPYQVSFVTTDAGNVVKASQVRIAGVEVGSVQKVENLGVKGARITLSLDEGAPLHEGVKFRVGERSVIGEGHVNIVDGRGESLPSGTDHSGNAVLESVQLRDVVAAFDQPTRKALGESIRALGDGTDGRSAEIDQLFTALDILGKEGYTAVDALGAQSDDIRSLVREAGIAVDALSRSKRDLGDLVTSADRVTSATAGQSDSIRESMDLLPGVMRNARDGLEDLEDLNTDLSPVARDLREAAPPLTLALQQLPATAGDLRKVMPDLDLTLQRAPATLTRVPAFTTETRAIIPTVRETISQGGPVVGYLSPYGRDMAAFFTNFANAMHATDELGLHYVRLESLINEQSLTGVPVTLPEVITWKNPYPAAGQGVAPGPEGGRDFVRVHAAPK